ncbi:MAG: ATP-binding protein [Aeromonas sp.]
MQLIRRSLHIKLLLSALLMIAIIMAFAVLALYRGHNEELAKQVSSRMHENLSHLLSSASGDLLDGSGFESISRHAIDKKLDSVICQGDGTRLWANLHRPEVMQARKKLCSQLVDYLAKQPDAYNFKLHTQPNEVGYFVYSLRLGRQTPTGLQSYYLVMLDSAANYQRLSRAYLLSTVQQALLFYALLAGLLLLSTAWSLRSLGELARQIDEIRAGKRAALANHYERELMPLTQSVNQLLENERQQTQRYQHALNDLAHSLKTRLALIQMTTQELHLARETADNINEQILTMDQMIQYQLRRAVAGRQGLASKGIDPAALVEKLLASLGKVYRHKRLDTVCHAHGAPLFYGEQGDLMELMGNLLDNACKFAISKVQVTLIKIDKALTIEVEDDGPGIDPTKSQLIFMRGVRADTSSGQGIGLAVVTEIVHSYGGAIHVDSSHLGGARFRLQFPAP